MPLTVSIRPDDRATPLLRQLVEGVGQPAGLRHRIAGRVERITRDYILRTGAGRHKTAQRLQAAPTLHYVRSAQTVAARATNDGVQMTVRGEIYARLDRDVTVRPRGAKYLTIPASRMAYGRRAREISGLVVIRMKTGRLALVRRTGSGPLKSIVVYYWLARSARLPQDRTLLPSDAAYAGEMEAAAADYIDTLAAAEDQGNA
ncbi:MAG: hypothetical protein QM784_27990 [Polyangiaceae bacterium]